MDNDSALAAILERIPRDADRLIVLYPQGSQTAIAWFGMSPAQAAETLYKSADDVVRQRIPLRPPIGER